MSKRRIIRGYRIYNDNAFYVKYMCQSEKLYNITFTLYMQDIGKNRPTIQGCFTAMLGEWLQSSPNPTWSQLVEVLRSPDINRPDIAAEIEDKYIKSDDSSVQESKDTAGQ